MARKKCWNCKWAITGNNYSGTECNYAVFHKESRTIQAYRACGVDHATEETDRRLAGESCAFYEQGARVYRKVESVPLPGSNPKALTKEPKKAKRYDWAKAREMYAQGLHDAEIGAALGCSATTVFEWRRREGLLPIKRRTETRYDWEKAREMFDRGCGASAIARELGCSLSSVKVWRQREGLHRPGPNWDKAAEMHREGASAREIAEAIGVKERTVQDWARRERLVFPDARDVPASQKRNGPEM